MEKPQNVAPETVAAEGPTGKARMMVLRAFLAQNVAVGCAFGGFGVAALPLQRTYGASTGTVALALSFCVLVFGLVGPAIGALIGRIGLRWTMMTGLLLSATGYALLAFAPSMTVVLLLYALPVGIGFAMFGPFPSSILASNWYAHNPGMALGIANTPLIVALLPLVGMVVIRDHGLTSFMLMLAALHIAIIPLILGVADKPAGNAPVSSEAHAPQPDLMIPARQLLRTPSFWSICIGAGFLGAIGITGVSHLAAVAAERGIAAAEAAALLSIMGGSAVFGALAIGALCSKLGAAPALALLAVALAASWLVLMGTNTFALMAICSLVLGAAGAGVFPAVNMLSARLFGQETLPRVLGLFQMLTLPLTFGVPPLVGVLRDGTGGYGPVIAALSAGCGLTAIVFVLLARTGSRTAHALAS